MNPIIPFLYFLSWILGMFSIFGCIYTSFSVFAPDFFNDRTKEEQIKIRNYKLIAIGLFIIVMAGSATIAYLLEPYMRG
jgi:hypothetical protein